MKRYFLPLACLFSLWSAFALAQPTNTSNQNYRDARNNNQYQNRPSNGGGHHHNHHKPAVQVSISCTPPVVVAPPVVVTPPVSGCFRDERVWVNGSWGRDQWGRPVWLAGYWTVQKVAIPCPLPVVAPVGPCGQPSMPDGAFQAALNSVSSRTFESSKISIAEEIIGMNCLTSAQVRELMMQFTYESSRLRIAKIAYARTYDPQYYYIVNDAFTFESSIQDLNNFIGR